MASGTYGMDYNCTNCGHHWRHSIPMGEKAHRGAHCPRCACKTGLPVWPMYNRPRAEPMSVPGVDVSPAETPWGDPPSPYRPAPRYRHLCSMKGR